MPIGFIACWIQRDDDVILTKEANHYGYVSDVYIEETWRGKGVFQILLQKTIDHLKTRNVQSIKLNVVAQNERALAAYLKVGFKSEEISLRMKI